LIFDHETDAEIVGRGVTVKLWIASRKDVETAVDAQREKRAQLSRREHSGAMRGRHQAPLQVIYAVIKRRAVNAFGSFKKWTSRIVRLDARDFCLRLIIQTIGIDEDAMTETAQRQCLARRIKLSESARNG
jgi:hypothetical protein